MEPTLYDRYKTTGINGEKLVQRLQQLQQEQVAIQQRLAEMQGAMNLLVELDPSLPKKLKEELEAKKQTEKVVEA